MFNSVSNQTPPMQFQTSMEEQKLPSNDTTTSLSAKAPVFQPSTQAVSIKFQEVVKEQKLPSNDTTFSLSAKASVFQPSGQAFSIKFQEVVKEQELPSNDTTVSLSATAAAFQFSQENDLTPNNMIASHSTTQSSEKSDLPKITNPTTSYKAVQSQNKEMKGTLITFPNSYAKITNSLNSSLSKHLKQLCNIHRVDQFFIWSEEACRLLEDKGEIYPLLLTKYLQQLGKRSVNKGFKKIILDCFNKNSRLYDLLINLALKNIEQIDSVDLIFYASIFPSSVVQNFCAQWEARLIKKIEVLTPEFLCNVLKTQFKLNSLCRVSYSNEFYNTWEAAAIQKMDQFESKNVLTLSHYLSKMLTIPSKEFWIQWRISLAKNMPQYESQLLRQIFGLHASFGAPLSDEFYKLWLSAAVNKKFSLRDSINLFYDYALLNLTPPSWLLNNLDFSQNEIEKQLIKNTDCITTLYKATIAFYLKKHDFANFFLNSWKNKFAIASKSNKNALPQISFFQQEIHTSLIKIFSSTDIQEEAWFDCIMSRVDFYIAKENLIIEVDGPSHYFVNSDQPTPSSLLRDFILSTSSEFHDGKKILHIPYFEWKKLETDSQKEEYLKDKLSQVIKM